MVLFDPSERISTGGPDTAVFDGYRRNRSILDKNERFSTMRIETAPIAVFQERSVPAATRLAGWAALVRAFNVAAPGRRPSCVSDQHVRGSRRSEGDWTVYDKRYWPGGNFADHLGFA